MTLSEEEQGILDDIAYEESPCKYCGLPMHMHDDSDFCPPGTEEAGGRR